MDIMDKVIDITGLRFGRWSVLRRNGVDTDNKAMWLCRCDCGRESIVLGKSLRSGKSLSCGCLLREILLKKHTTHGKRKSLEYSSWTRMKQRCCNPRDSRYKDYGERGIAVCERWLTSFENFYNDMGVRPSKEYSLDRINVNGNYEPTNCKWATSAEQRRNRRDSAPPQSL